MRTRKTRISPIAQCHPIPHHQLNRGIGRRRRPGRAMAMQPAERSDGLLLGGDPREIKLYWVVLTTHPARCFWCRVVWTTHPVRVT